jgi:hypothetical protein
VIGRHGRIELAFVPAIRVYAFDPAQRHPRLFCPPLLLTPTLLCRLLPSIAVCLCRWHVQALSYLDRTAPKIANRQTPRFDCCFGMADGRGKE